MSRVKMRKARCASPTIKPNSAVFCSVIFFRPPGHYVRNITLLNRNISYVYHIVAMCVIKHPGHTYRGFGSVLLRTGV
jgi:hypothetical protein